MKKLLVLATIFVIISAYIFFDYRNRELSESQENDPAFNYDIEAIALGGLVKEPINDTLSIGKIQTDYIMYNKGDITFDEHIMYTSANLRYVLNYPFNALPNYLFSVGYDEDSAVQYYFLGNNEQTRTVIFRVQAGKKFNDVSIFYDGPFFKLVAVSNDNLNVLEAYDSEHNLTTLEVE